MIQRHFISAMVIATAFMTFGCKERPPTNQVALYHCRYLVVDEESRKPIDFEITYSESVDPSLAGVGLTEIIKHADSSKSLIHVGPPVDLFSNKSGITVYISADGYTTKSLKIQPNTSKSIFVKEEIFIQGLEQIKDSEKDDVGQPATRPESE